MATNFGDWSDYDLAKDSLFQLSVRLSELPRYLENERHFMLAAIRRTLSLEKAFRNAILENNGQMAMTLVRINLDTLARTYALYWADETESMTGEILAREVAAGRSFRSMKLRGSREPATDKWLIEQITPLAKWFPEVYRNTSGAIHFSDFHIKQLLQQAKPVTHLEPGVLLAELTFGYGEDDPPPAFYKELQQGFLHITLMLPTFSK